MLSIMIGLTVYFTLSLLAVCCGEQRGCSYCSSYPQSKGSKILLKEFCHDKNGTLIGRCCLNGNSTTGMDCSNCNLTDLTFVTDEIRSSAQWLSVNGNGKLNKDDLQFRSWGKLGVLVLSSDDKCGSGFNHSESAESLKICSQPVNNCDNFECPSNSHCHTDGPGLSMCLCNENWGGYKCLKKDGFPAVEWLVGFAVATVVICVTLRLLQAKGRKAGKEYMQQQKLKSSTTNNRSPVNNQEIDEVNETSKMD